ncbi:helix-turn-helix domain-containing protein [Sphingobium cupriresistens]|nr:helix-turn-helix domain-containing protein [Sphingobium cupriresistens]
MPFDPDNTVAKQCDGGKPFDPDRGLDGFALMLFRLRFRELKLSQRAFAQRYGLGYPTIRDLEQGATKPTPAIRLIVAAIARDPKGMEAAADDARLMAEGR